ncbi:hypothetical protein L2E82_17332 [Cichorium intybus]|uniref:Uncharacterized protein n=1 Tax=Cichorium intybus TaxID=13427 RepID=A0ACB9F7B4_CICIN|nr:hypothetical protein L2E82_17332 [Cichorium intybus]
MGLLHCSTCYDCSKNHSRNPRIHDTLIPEPPMFRPEFPPQEQNLESFFSKSEDRVETVVKCLPQYDPATNCNSDSTPFRYWKIRDYAYSYRTSRTTPSMNPSMAVAIGRLEDDTEEKEQCDDANN